MVVLQVLPLWIVLNTTQILKLGYFRICQTPIVLIGKGCFHEAGHMFGLGHDGYKTEKTWNDYHAGITTSVGDQLWGVPFSFQSL